MKLDKIYEANTEHQTGRAMDPWRREKQESHIYLGFLPGGTFQILAQGSGVKKRTEVSLDG